MALPKLVTPEFETIIPSTKERIRFRPFLVKEEKVLYMALESDEEKEIQNAICNVLEACILTENVNVRKLAAYDVEYLFLQLRSKSVGENIELNLRHGNASECKHITEYILSYNDIEVEFNEKHQNNIKINDKYGIKLIDPSYSIITENVITDQDDFENILNIIARCVVCVYDEENVYDDFTNDEIKNFLLELTQKQFEEIKDFFDTLPKLQHEMHWTCSECGKEESLKLEGLKSFFM